MSFDPHKSAYVFYSDPGHEWLAVPFSALKDLDIEKEISSYSYTNKHKTVAYLEGDCDAAVFLKAFQEKYGFRPKWIDSSTNGQSHVRRMPHYIQPE
tara:strand:+ start:1968 stop:2258 length:291 start_codon:yes stop_codon:yes gene_type:complete